MSRFSTDPAVCLCCNQRFTKPGKPGKPLTPERAARNLEWLLAIGLTREDMLGPHREQLEYQAPGFVDWLKGRLDG